MQGSRGNLKLRGPRIGYKIFVRKRETKDGNSKDNKKITKTVTFWKKKRIFYNKMDTKF